MASGKPACSSVLIDPRRRMVLPAKSLVETLKRRERVNILRPSRLDGRIVRYLMSDVVRIEQEGFGDRLPWPRALENAFNRQRSSASV